MDLLIEHANSMSSETGVHLVYSTPSCFVKALHEDKSHNKIKSELEEGLYGLNNTDIKLSNSTTWRTMKDKDFFPYGTGISKMYLSVIHCKVSN